MECFHSGFVVFVVASTLFAGLCAALFTSVLIIGLYGASPHTCFPGKSSQRCAFRDNLEHARRSSHRLIGLDLDQYRAGVSRVAVIRSCEGQR